MSGPSIEAVNLSKRYGSFLALSNLSLKIEGSKCVGFLGPNGAGKTTTLKIFTDMIRASEGKALINGIDVIPTGRESRCKAQEADQTLIGPLRGPIKVWSASEPMQRLSRPVGI